MLLLFTVGAACAARAAHAEVPAARSDCSKPAIRKARADADKAMRARQPGKAIAALEPLASCADEGDVDAAAWVASDLAAAYDQNGQYLECARLMAPLSHPSSRVASGKLQKAIEYNLDHCRKAIDKRYESIRPGGCPLKIAGAIATAMAPPALAPKGAAAACLALVPGPPASKPPPADGDEHEVVCPRIALVWGVGKAERRELAADSGGLVDDSVCCNLGAIAAGALDGKTLVRLRGQGRDCNGGTADAATDVFYEWNGKALAAPIDVSVSFH